MIVWIFPWDIGKILVILGTLGIPGYAQPKWYYQLVENFHVYLLPENQLHHPRFSVKDMQNFLFEALVINS